MSQCHDTITGDTVPRGRRCLSASIRTCIHGNRTYARQIMFKHIYMYHINNIKYIYIYTTRHQTNCIKTFFSLRLTCLGTSGLPPIFEWHSLSYRPVLGASSLPKEVSIPEQLVTGLLGELTVSLQPNIRHNEQFSMRKGWANMADER